MVKARRLQSGAWNVRVKCGDSYKSITADTKEKAEEKAVAYQRTHDPRYASKMTVGEVIDRYLELSPMLSPTTLNGYEIIREHGFPSLMDRPVDMLTNREIQMAINEESFRVTHRGKRISAKTVKNEWGLVAAALRNVVGLQFPVRLPRYQKAPKYYPDPQAIVDAIRGTDIELPCLLAMWLSFSMSEIRGLTQESVRDGFIYVLGVNVEVRGESIVKPTGKAASRLRKLRLPAYIADLLPRDSFFLVPKSRDAIYGRWQTICKQNGLGNLSFHDLRHYSASIGLNVLGLPEKVMQERGGWSTPIVMNATYSHAFSRERNKADDLFDAYFNGLLARDGHENRSNFNVSKPLAGSSPVSSAKRPEK